MSGQGKGFHGSPGSLGELFGKSEEWQIAYMAALAAVFSGTAKDGESWLGGVSKSELVQGFVSLSNDVFGVGAEELRRCGVSLRGRLLSGGDVPVKGSMGVGGGRCGTSGQLRADVERVEQRECSQSVDGSAVEVEPPIGAGGFSDQCDLKGKNWERNRAWKAEKKRKRDLRKIPQWRRSCDEPVLSTPSLSTSAVTVDSRTAEEIEAARTLAVRRTFENRLAVVKTKHQLASYADKDKTEAIKRLEVARIEERINTTKAKSQASYKKCDTPLNSVGSAGSAGEFAWKQEIRKRDAVQKKSDYFEQQLELAMKYLPDVGKRAIAELPEPYIPSLEDIEFEDADISPYYSREEMEAEAAKWVGNEAW